MQYNLCVKRSNRRSISICVTADNQITVRCPLHMTDECIDAFVKRKEKWLSNVLLKNAKNLSLHAKVMDYREIYVKGERLPLVQSDKNLVTNEAVYVRGLTEIKKVFLSYFAEEFLHDAQELSERYYFHVKSFSIGAYKSKWGCCDRNKNITFNYLLLMLPKDIQRYVIFHELCHTVHFNHSEKFWQLVAKYEPDYLSLRKQLRLYDFLIPLYC